MNGRYIYEIQCMTLRVNPLRPMEFSVYTLKSGWFIIYIEGSQVTISKKYCTSSFVLANSADPDEMPIKCGISSGSSLFAKVPIFGFLVFKGLNLCPLIGLDTHL